MISILLTFLVLGSVAGFLSGLLGIGGGIVIVPVLSLIFLSEGYPNETVMHYAVGSSIACIVLTTLTGYLAHKKSGNIDPKLVKLLVPGLIVGVIFGVYFSHNASSKLLSIIFGVCIFLIALKMILEKKTVEHSKAMNPWIIRGFTVVIGALASSLGLGGGVFIVPLLTAAGNPINKAVGSGAACSFVIASCALIGHLSPNIPLSERMAWSTGYIHWPAVGAVVITGMLFANFGAKMTNCLPALLIKRIFAVLLITTSVKLMLSV